MREITNSDLALGRSWCVAGGWAACPQLASDQDVWIFVESVSADIPEDSEHLMQVGAEILEVFTEIVPETSQTPDEVLQTYGDLGYLVSKVGTLNDRHILVTSAYDISMLLESFDISTHQCAIDSDMRFIKGYAWTPITEIPRRLRNTETTEERFAKISNRYQSFRKAA